MGLCTGISRVKFKIKHLHLVALVNVQHRSHLYRQGWAYLCLLKTTVYAVYGS